MTRGIRGALSVWFLPFLLYASSAIAQTAAGTIVGTVSDETGAMLPGVTVAVVNMDTSLTRTLLTDVSGRYAAPNLPPGPYSVKASLQGFGSIVRSGITLTVGREAVVDLMMKIGGVESQVTVVAEAPTVDIKTSSTGSVITG